VKSLTVALGAMIAASALVYLNESDVTDEADLVAPKEARRGAETAKMDGVVNEKPANVLITESINESLNDAITKERDRTASLAKLNLFRVLEAPPAAAVVAPQVAPPSTPVIMPAPAFSFLGSFTEGAELQAIIQIGEKVEFVKPSQVIAGFRVDSVDSNALGWTHEPTSIKGLLRARVAK
jgi:hypothetical protein